MGLLFVKTYGRNNGKVTLLLDLLNKRDVLLYIKRWPTIFKCRN